MEMASEGISIFTAKEAKKLRSPEAPEELLILVKIKIKTILLIISWRIFQKK